MRLPSSIWWWAAGRLRPYRRLVLLLLALSGAEILLRVATPWALQATVDHVFGALAPPAALANLASVGFSWCTSSPRIQLLLAIGTLGLLAHLAHHAVLWLHTRTFAALGLLVTKDLRTDLFWHLQCLALAHHARTPAGDAVYRLSADATCIEQLVLRAAVPALASGVTLVTMFVVLLGIDVWLAVVSLAVIPGLWLSLQLHRRRMAGEAERVKALESRALEHAQESLAMIRLVKTFARETHERERFSGAARQATRARLAMILREAGFSFIVGSLTAGGTTLVLMAGGIMVVEGRISAGTLLLVLTYLGFIYGPLSAISHSTAVTRDAIASAHRIRGILATAPEPVAAPDPPAPHRVQGAIRFENVSFAYVPGHPVLDDLSFEIAPGEFVAMVGPSGSGKTTVTALLTRLFEPTRGRVLIDGIDASTLPLRALREQIAVVVQEGVLMSGTVFENLRYGRLDASPEEVVQAAVDAHAHEFITALPQGYDTPLGSGGTGLSGGQRQRLSIARAFLKNAPILVLDEPTSALDTLSEAQFVAALERLRQRRTTLVIAHRLSTVRGADRILVLDRGRLVASGTHRELLASCPLYAKLAEQLEQAA